MPVDVIMPKVDMVMDQGTVALWHKAEGDQVRAGEPLFDIETDKATMEVEAPATGTLARISAHEGTAVPVATVIALIVEPGETLDTAQVQPQQPSAPVALAALTPDARPRATPLARKMAAEHGLELTAVIGNGPQGRIRKSDVLQAVEQAHPSNGSPGNGSPEGVPAAAPAAAPPHAARETSPLPAAQPSPGGKLVPLAGVRKIVAERLTLSATIPQFTLQVDVDMTAASALRERLPYRPSFTALLARVVGPLLQRHPSLNASFRADGIWLHDHVHLGIALDSHGDLLVPVIRDAHRRTLHEFHTALGDLRARAEARQLGPRELQGSTFTISNLGMFGIDRFTALINPPEAAILAVGGIARKPVEAGATLAWKPMLTLTLSADHRVTDGAAAAKFVQDVRAALEDPYMLL